MIERCTSRGGIGRISYDVVVAATVYPGGRSERGTILENIAPCNAGPGTIEHIYTDAGVIGDGGAVDVNQAAVSRLARLDAGRV